MELFVGVLALLAGVVCVVAGVKGRASQLFTTVTGVGITPTPAPAANGSAGHPSMTAAAPAGNPVQTGI